MYRPEHTHREWVGVFSDNFLFMMGSTYESNLVKFCEIFFCTNGLSVLTFDCDKMQQESFSTQHHKWKNAMCIPLKFSLSIFRVNRSTFLKDLDLMVG